MSNRLKEYLINVEQKTSRPIKKSRRRGHGLKGQKASFVLKQGDHSVIRIYIMPDANLLDPKTERGIAHEATHGLLYYAMGFCYPFFHRDKFRTRSLIPLRRL